jgi:hypothetical protein
MTTADRKLAADVAYDGLVKMHAQELMRCERFRRTGQLSHNEVHKVARDLDDLRRPHELDATIELILAATDALELQRQAADRQCSDDVPTIELKAGIR